MNLIKILCCMLALALVLGILTSGGPEGESPEETGPVSGTEGEGEGITVNNSSLTEISKPGTEETAGTAGLGGTQEKERKSSSGAVSDNTNPVIPKPPAPTLLENGTGEIAIRKRFLESRLRTAAGLIETNGEEAFSEFREEGSSWFYGDYYIFVWSMDGTLVVYPPNGSREGMNLEGLKDSEGKPIGELFLETARSDAGEGWVDYNWPGSSGPSRKHTFIKRVRGKDQTYLIGTGFYPEAYIISRNLEECKVLENKGDITVSELFNPEKLDQKPELDCSIIHSALGVGESLASRLVKTPKALYVLEGEGLLYLDDVPMKLRPGQLVYIPEGSFQTVYNTGNKSLLFLSVNRPIQDEESEENFD